MDNIEHLGDAQVNAAALRGFFGIVGKWGLSEWEQRTLLGDSAVFEQWKATKKVDGLDEVVVQRIGDIFQIYKALRMLFPQAEIADAWVKQSNCFILFYCFYLASTIFIVYKSICHFNKGAKSKAIAWSVINTHIISYFHNYPFLVE